MEQEKNQLTPPRQAVVLGKRIAKPTGRFLAFLICGSILIAAFAMSSLWLGGEGESLFGRLSAFFQGGEKGVQTPNEEEGKPSEPPTADRENGDAELPEGAILIRGMDLSAADRGVDYFQNETAYCPNVAELRARPWETVTPDMQKPLVLILHTHATEAYLSEAATYLPSPVGDAIYSEDAARGVIAVGDALTETLNRSGIPTLHCWDLHGEAGTLRNSYACSAECVETYLARYPSIQYVIDLHRDSILTGDGAYVRTETTVNGTRIAQVMAVVGTDGNGTEHSAWEQNLSLALQLRDGLNAQGSLCRPVSLRNASYNQELAPHALLLEIGSGANTVEEAKRAAVLVGEALARIIKGE